MPEIELTEAAEEALTAIWSAREERGDGQLPVPDPALLVELQESGLVQMSAGRVSMTPSGEQEAAAIIRRERLAERLLADVLAVGESEVTQAACRFEHLLRRGIDDRICTLLGHPRACPHGNPIPPGGCCRARADAPGQVVSSLADLQPGQGGAIAYIQTNRRELLQRLLAMGALPGVAVTLRQRFPSFVLDLGQGQVAVDAETARDIYVHLNGEPGPSPGAPWWKPRFKKRARKRRG